MIGMAGDGDRLAPRWAFATLIILHVVSWPRYVGLGLISGMACDSGCSATGEAIVYSIIALCVLVPPVLVFLTWREMRARRRFWVLLALSPSALLFVLFTLWRASGLLGAPAG